ncbi:MAG: response regulator [Nitrospirae bacterium]|nr:response regulator [Nitrospirota bacterium]
MNLNAKELTILHVEDDHIVSGLVREAFTSFGFPGAMLTAASVREALDLLREREKVHEALGLIISAMQLPDGTGLDLIREVKTSSFWRRTPVIVLSSEASPGVINTAYALGANSYMPKLPRSTGVIDSLQSFYKCWLENAYLPEGGVGDRLQDALLRAIGLRTRTAEFYLGLAGVSPEGTDEMKFWLDRALNEGNMSNLLSFFRNKLEGTAVAADIIDRLAGMQLKVNEALRTAEEQLRKTPAPGALLCYQWALEIMDAWDEEIFAEALSCLFPVSSVAARALKTRAAAQIKSLALHILEQAEDVSLRQKAVSLLEWSQRLA